MMLNKYSSNLAQDGSSSNNRNGGVAIDNRCNNLAGQNKNTKEVNPDEEDCIQRGVSSIQFFRRAVSMITLTSFKLSPKFYWRHL